MKTTHFASFEIAAITDEKVAWDSSLQKPPSFGVYATIDNGISFSYESCQSLSHMRNYLDVVPSKIKINYKFLLKLLPIISPTGVFAQVCLRRSWLPERHDTHAMALTGAQFSELLSSSTKVYVNPKQKKFNI